MPINAGFEFAEAEKKYLESSTDEEKLIALGEMLRTAPSHKGSEKFRGDLKLKIKKLKGQIQKSKKKTSGKKGFKKTEMQGVLIGLTNSGKSSILKSITNANPKIASYGFTTQEPEIGTLNYQGYAIQIIDFPPIASENFNRGIINNTDLIIIIVEKIHEINIILNILKNSNIKKLIVFNKSDLYDENTKRKIKETLRSKRYNFVLTSAMTGEGIEDLKQKIADSFNVLRIFTKKQGKEQDDTPVILPPGSTLEDAAKKILHGYSKKVKSAKIWGPSSKFPGQQVGLKHPIKDKDIVEFTTE